MDALAISLGHNSSAVLIRDGKIVGGYEEERFTQKKSDSSFPINAISELDWRFNVQPNVSLCVSHWFPDGEIEAETKYWSFGKMRELFPECQVMSLSSGFTHHDAHAESAIVFVGDDFVPEYGIFVVDGFGTAAEHVSVYEKNENGFQLKQRIHGYRYSLGLFYQYATAFCGMKMHQDEYKMLAYETHIREVTGYEGKKEILDKYVDNFSKYVYDVWSCGLRYKSLGPLDVARKQIEAELSVYLEQFASSDDEREHRIVVSYFAQRHLENMLRRLYVLYPFKNLLVVGGVFYNVKLNSMLCDLVPGKFCAMPLAGDQGAGLGVYQRYFRDLQWPGHLFWGHRTLNRNALSNVAGIEFVRSDEMASKIKREIEDVGFVNVVRGPMEFGPRALCHTSTLALPSVFVGKQINEMNGRLNEMPFGLVVTPGIASVLFKETDKVHRSLDYMIITRNFRKHHEFSLEGGAHYYSDIDTYTCRPQVTRDPVICEVLGNKGPLINTSFNYHGVPIVRSTKEALYTHVQERKKGYHFRTLIEEEVLSD
jgi:predicted NodU family carbamoyl transferase